MASLAQGNEDDSGKLTVPKSVSERDGYEPLADGEYDVIVLGTGMKECVLAGLLSVKGKKVLQIDRNDYYGGQCASLDMESTAASILVTNMTRQQKTWTPATLLGRLDSKVYSGKWETCKDAFAQGVTRYIDFQGVEASYVFTSGQIYKVPVTPAEALRTSLVGFFQKISSELRTVYRLV